MSLEPGPDESGQDSADPQWKPVPHEELHHPPLPNPVKYGGLALLALLLVGAVLAGIGLGGGFSSDPSGEPSPAFAMELPVQVGDFVRGDENTSEAPVAGGSDIVRADYSDGTNRVVVLLSYPEHDVIDFLHDAGVDASAEEAPLDVIQCGTSADTGQNACALVTQNTGLLVLSLTENDEDVHTLVEQFRDALQS